MDRFIRVTGCHRCPWNRTKLPHVKDGVLRTECGVSPDIGGGFKECSSLTITSEQQPIPEWCPLEFVQEVKV